MRMDDWPDEVTRQTSSTKESGWNSALIISTIKNDLCAFMVGAGMRAVVRWAAALECQNNLILRARCSGWERPAGDICIHPAMDTRKQAINIKTHFKEV